VITYFDASSIVKWLFEESYSGLAEQARVEADFAVTSLVAYPEVLSAIRRAWKEGRCSESEVAFVRNEFLRVWEEITWIRPSERLVLETQSLIFLHGLRGYDAVHLASALALKREAEAEILFSCFDRNLNRAASREGLHIHQDFMSEPREE
jgi:predicted nucleic acid-binding protein